ncbi:hypothetical protein [Nocardia rhizosphaerae]|uniref:DUF1449 family protein n=1 Tax=Nocardia rhizosphaerae TaxID=1691571 RepID=A0ABV8L9F5_9NOCA
MSEFFAATLSFPTALFSFALLVVLGYWLLVALGGAGIDVLDDDESGVAAPVFDVIGLGGVPTTVAVTGLVSVSWFLSLIGTVAIGAVGLGGVAAALLGGVILVAAAAGAVWLTRFAVLPLRRFFRDGPAPSKHDFVGRVCVVRTGRVDTGFGQAELTSADGSAAVIQVRQSAQHAATDPLRQGDSAVVYDYDPAADLYWVAALEGNY